MTRHSLRRALLIMPLLSLAACTSTPTPENPVTPPTPPPSTALPLRPAGTPDYYVLGISGKCLRDALERWCWNLLPASAGTVGALNTRNNYNYLVSRGTLPDLASAVAQRGWATAYKGYAASLPDRVNTSSGVEALHPGFLTFTRDVMNIYQTQIKGVQNPSRIILAAHSHGTVWAHLFTFLHPEVPIEIQVDFDGVCLYWPTDNKGDFQDAGLGDLINFSDVCHSTDALGGNPLDWQNLTGKNVRYNLDLHSTDVTFHDSTDNHRLDGSTTGIYSATFDESHSGVTQRGSQGLTWAAQSVYNLTPLK